MKPIKAYLNIAKMRVNMTLRRKALNNYPIYAVIDPASFCNLRCPGCPTGLRLGWRSTCAIKWELYKGIIDEIGDYLFKLDLFNWGEPLLNKQTPEFIRYAKSKEIKVTVSTNLSLDLSDEYIQSLIKSGLDELIVSIDGATEDTYLEYRRGGNFSLVRDNMQRIQSTKKALRVNTPNVTWQFLVFRHNEHDIEMAKSNYKDWGADSLIVRGAFMPFVKPYDEEFQPSTIPLYNVYLQEQQLQAKSKHQPRRNRPCSWLYEGFTLNSNGKVSPCCAISVEKDDFAEYSPSTGFFHAWNSDRFKRARSHLICDMCPMRSLPFIMDMPEWAFTNELSAKLSLVLRKRDIRHLFPSLMMLLMAGPNAWKSMARSLCGIMWWRISHLFPISPKKSIAP